MDDLTRRVEFELLLSQHRAALDQANALARRMEMVALRGSLLLAAVAALVFETRASMTPAFGWLAPLVFLVVFAAWIGLAARQVAAAWQVRILSAQLARLGVNQSQGEPLPSLVGRLLGWPAAGPAAPGAERPAVLHASADDPLNLWRAEWKLRLLVAAPVLLFVSMLAVSLFLCGRAVHHASPLQGLAFAVVYLLLIVVEAAALQGALRGLPRYYAALHHAAIQGDALPESPRPTILDGLGRLVGQLLPLPVELRWSWTFWAGVLSVPLLGLALEPDRLSIINALFPSHATWETASSVPLPAVVGLALIYFLFAELLLQQAAALWHMRYRADQPGLRKALPPAGTLVRWALALLPAWWLGGEPLVALFVAISVFTVVDVLLVGPAGAKRPALALLFGAGGLPLRFLAGALVWGVPAWALAVYQALALVIYFTAMALLAGRGLWRRAGLIAALLVAGIVLVFQILAEACTFEPDSFLGGLYGACPGGKLTYAATGLGNGLLVVFDLLVFMLLIALMLAVLVGLVQEKVRFPLGAVLRPMFAGLFVLLALAAFAIALLEPRPAWAVVGAMAGLLSLLSLRT